MPDITTNYGFKMPKPNEYAKPDDFNENFINLDKLLKPFFDTTQKLDENIVPYTDHWWRIRQTAGSYSLKVIPFGQISGAYTYNSSNEFYFIEITYSRSATSSNSGWDGTITLQYASSVTMDSSGNVSLVNPTSLTVNASTIESYASTLNGKYVKGLSENEDLIYKINTASISTYSERWSLGASDEVETYVYYGYKFSSLTSTGVQVAVSSYTESNSDFSYVSNSDSEFYPHSGTQGGIEYQYLGKIFDVAVKAEPCNLQTVNITSASWTNGSCTIAIPHSRYLLWWGDSTDLHGGFLMVISGKCYGNYSYHYYSSSSYVTDEHEYHARGATKINTGNQASVTAIQFSTSGLTLTGSGTATFYYLPI